MYQNHNNVNGFSLWLKTCHGDTSLFGYRPSTYYVASGLYNGFGPPYAGDCHNGFGRAPPAVIDATRFRV